MESFARRLFFLAWSNASAVLTATAYFAMVFTVTATAYFTMAYFTMTYFTMVFTARPLLMRMMFTPLN